MTTPSAAVGRAAALEQAVDRLVLVAPALFGAAYVLDQFAVSSAVLPELVRPLLLAMATGAAFTLGLRLILRDPGWACLLASALVLGLAVHPVPALVVLGLVAWRAAHAIPPVRRKLTRFIGAPNMPSRVALTYSVILLVAGIWTSVQSLDVGEIGSPPELPPVTGAATGPNVYVLLLDGYPRADTLEADFGFDNGPFLSDLAELGFDVATEARTNHNKTWMSTAVLVNGQYVADLPEVVDFPRAAQPQARLSHVLINNAAALDRMRDLGYQVVSIPSALVSTDVTADASVWSSWHFTSFEIALATRSLAARVLPDAVLGVLAGDARALAAEQLGALAAEASKEADAPRVVLAHVMPPHPPFVLGQEPDFLEACFPGCSIWESTPEGMGISPDEYARRMGIQVSELNRLVVVALDAIVAADPDAIVVVWSDHGARRHEDADDEHFRTLFAARTPGQPDLFTDDQAPVNVFRRILSSVSNESFPDLPYEAWASDWDWPMEMTPYP
jgi:hypothetical protein